MQATEIEPLRFWLEHPLDLDARAVLREELDVVFCDENEVRPGCGFLAPDCTVTISEGETRGRWRLMVHRRTPQFGPPTSPEWIREQLDAAADRIGATLEPRS